jgi:hypothetical protein
LILLLTDYWQVYGDDMDYRYAERCAVESEGFVHLDRIPKMLINKGVSHVNLFVREAFGYKHIYVSPVSLGIPSKEHSRLFPSGFYIPRKLIREAGLSIRRRNLAVPYPDMTFELWNLKSYYDSARPSLLDDASDSLTNHLRAPVF